jgi:hypothetical protein
MFWVKQSGNLSFRKDSLDSLEVIRWVMDGYGALLITTL